MGEWERVYHPGEGVSVKGGRERAVQIQLSQSSEFKEGKG